MGDTFVVTGATGFVGGALAKRLLSDGNRVIALVRDGKAPEGCEVVSGELEDFQVCARLINEARPDGVFHLGAQALVGAAKGDPLGTFESNVRGTYNVLEAFRRHRKDHARIVVASSDKAYGELRDEPGSSPYELMQYREDDRMDGRGIYDVSKSCTDLIAQSYAWQFGLDLAIVRAGNVYGPGDREMTRIVPSIMRDLAEGRPAVIMSNGKPRRDYLYIDDAVEGYLAVDRYLAGRPENRYTYPAFNFSGGEVLSVLELVRMIVNDVAHVPQLRIEIRSERMVEIPAQRLCTKRAQSALGWSPKVKLLDGLRMTWMWYNGITEEP